MHNSWGFQASANGSRRAEIGLQARSEEESGSRAIPSRGQRGRSKHNKLATHEKTNRRQSATIPATPKAIAERIHLVIKGLTAMISLVTRLQTLG